MCFFEIKNAEQAYFLLKWKRKIIRNIWTFEFGSCALHFPTWCISTCEVKHVKCQELRFFRENFQTSSRWKDGQMGRKMDEQCLNCIPPDVWHGIIGSIASNSTKLYWLPAALEPSPMYSKLSRDSSHDTMFPWTTLTHFESNLSLYYGSYVIDARARLHPNAFSCNFSWLASKQSEKPCMPHRRQKGCV